MRWPASARPARFSSWPTVPARRLDARFRPEVSSPDLDRTKSPLGDSVDGAEIGSKTPRRSKSPAGCRRAASDKARRRAAAKALAAPRPSDRAARPSSFFDSISSCSVAHRVLAGFSCRFFLSNSVSTLLKDSRTEPSLICNCDNPFFSLSIFFLIPSRSWLPTPAPRSASTVNDRQTNS